MKGNGKCVNVNFEETGPSKKVESVDFHTTKKLCMEDPNCVAFAFSRSKVEPSTLYTTTDCENNCNNEHWMNDPSLIHSAYTIIDNEFQYGECWKLTCNLSLIRYNHS